MKRIIYIDFDGVLNTYNGWKGNTELFEPKVDARKFLHDLSKVYAIYVFTSRDPLVIESWLIKYDLKDYVVDVTNVKKPAFAYIDDRAIRFDGDYEKAIIDLFNFKPYWQKSSHYWDDFFN